jgi:hypothetical protein
MPDVVTDPSPVPDVVTVSAYEGLFTVRVNEVELSFGVISEGEPLILIRYAHDGGVGVPTQV